MRLKSLRIKNFRCFPDNKWGFNSHFNVVIGNNASGKTTILDALSIGIGSFFLGIDDVYAKTILYKDIRKNTYSESREYQLPSEIELVGTVNENKEDLDWQRSVLSSKGNTKREKDTNKLVRIAAEMQRRVRDGEKINLPVFNYYGTGRLWIERRKTINTLSPASRLDGYTDSIEPISTSNTFIAWIKTRTLTELQTQVKDDALVLVKAVVGCFLDKHTRIQYDVKFDSIVLENVDIKKGISKILWNEMSDGYRNVVAMAADLAYRCYTLNNHLGIYAAEKSEGVILIDEIDLHLHPLWQKTIVNSFKKAFPNLQFITTTHSPFIIQSLKNEELIDLEGKDLADDYYKKSIEDIAEAEMHVNNPQRSEKFLEMQKVADEYYSIISNGINSNKPEDVEKIKTEPDKLLIPFYDDPAYVSFLQTFKPQLEKK